MRETHSSAPMAAPWALFETSWALARPDSLISALMRKTGMSASSTFFTAPIEPSASAGSMIIATDWLEIAVSTRLFSSLVSPLWAPTVALYPSSSAFAAARSPSVFQYGLDGSLTMMVIRPPSPPPDSPWASVSSSESLAQAARPAAAAPTPMVERNFLRSMLGSFRSEHDIRISVGSGQVSGFRHGATPCGGQEVVSSSLEASGGPGARPSRWEGASGLGPGPASAVRRERSEEHTSELQSRGRLVCRLLLDKK